MSEDDVAGSMLDALANEGEEVDVGRFTLDAAAALAKLREYQLADAHEYLLILIEAAWIASRKEPDAGVTIDCGATTTVEFACPGLEFEMLPELFAAVWGKRDDTQMPARVLALLGLAANNAFALEAEAITIDALDANQAVRRLRISPGAEMTEGHGDLLRPGWIRFRLLGEGLGWVRAQTERELVDLRCRYAKLPVLLDGKLVSNQRPPLASDVPVIVDGRAIGFAGFCVEAQLGKIWIINRGIGLALPDGEIPPGFVAVVEADLPTDLSRAQFIEGPELAAIRRAIYDAARRSSQPEYRSSRSFPAANMLVFAAAVGVLGVGALVIAHSWSPTGPRGSSRIPSAEQECEQGLAEACAVARDQTFSEFDKARYSRLACEAGDSPSCVLAGKGVYDLGIRVQLLTLGCEGNDLPSCELLVETTRDIASSDGEHTPHRRALTLACRIAPGPSCVEAAWYHHYWRGVDWDREPGVDADFLLERGCAAGVELGCELRERPTLEQACEADDALACAALELDGGDRSAAALGNAKRWAAP